MGVRVAILWSELSGYADACFRALAGHPQTESLFLSHFRADPLAPFDASAFQWVDQRAFYDDLMAAGALTDRLRAFRPDVVLVTSWHIKGYRAALQALAGKAVRVLCMDNQWLGTARQRAGVAVSRWHVRPLYDLVFLPGERQADFARRLGFPQSAIRYGLYACDPARFAPPAGTGLGHGFVFVGRLIPPKGVDVLAAAYRQYRASAADPWPLTVYGSGPLGERLAAIEGVTLAGFVQPDALPAALHAAGAFVLPSLFEPWAVAIHEAAAAGLPLIVTAVCGASVHLVQDGLNGALVGAGDADGLAKAFARIAGLTPEVRAGYGRMSLALARQYTPARWAETVLAMP
ncbi:MAG: glycosyltransferase family 4 protein [Alphaproteobacteria bacterium]